MSLKIPADFDVNRQDLDPNETFIRDQLKLKIVNWAKFRYTINIGNEASNLHSLSGPLSNEVMEAYRELAKSHYEVITSLGSAKLSLLFAAQVDSPLVFKKSYKDFYFHMGCLLDNLARLIYIINEPLSATKTYLNGSLKGKFIRHWIDWGQLPVYEGYVRLKRSRELRGIINIRNNFTHGWICPIIPYENMLCWPIAIRTKRNFYWPYDEMNVLKKRYRKVIPMFQMMDTDLVFVENFQNKVFGKLVRDIKKFEKNNKLDIR